MQTSHVEGAAAMRIRGKCVDEVIGEMKTDTAHQKSSSGADRGGHKTQVPARRNNVSGVNIPARGNQEVRMG